MHTTTQIKDRSAQAGFTMLEIVLTLAIGAVLAVICAMSLRLVSETELRISAASEARDQSIELLSFVARELRSSTAILSPTSSDSAETLTYVGSGEITPSSFSFHDNALWWSDNGGTEFRISGSKVVVETFLTENFANAGMPGSIRITLGLAESSVYASGNLSAQEQLFTTSVTTRSTSL